MGPGSPPRHAFVWGGSEGTPSRGKQHPSRLGKGRARGSAAGTLPGAPASGGLGGRGYSDTTSPCWRASSAAVPAGHSRPSIACRRGVVRGPLSCAAGQGLPDLPLGGHRGTRGVLSTSTILGTMKFPVRIHKCSRWITAPGFRPRGPCAGWGACATSGFWSAGVGGSVGRLVAPPAPLQTCRKTEKLRCISRQCSLKLKAVIERYHRLLLSSRAVILIFKWWEIGREE